MQMVEGGMVIEVAGRTKGKVMAEETGMEAVVNTVAITRDSSAVAADPPQVATKMGKEAVGGRLEFRAMEEEQETLIPLQANLAEASSQGLHDLDWYINSGATHHVNLNIHDETLNSDYIYVRDGKSLPVLSNSPLVLYT
ncbi:hypothetical protein CRG98_020165 [Punica granatum]|uniref:Uncharacterized protein n=1 Tax=Punica granatum TaxID=22663 RepID=A0A2I0JVA0_PUNGR|nr:hypothetical protein CRG98_020165 [Punica granatum]